MPKNIIVQMDTLGYKEKPKGQEIAKIKQRTQNSLVQELTIEEFVKFIENGHSFSPGILVGGLSASNWVKQQLFAIDIDNENSDFPTINMKEAVKTCVASKIKPVICYKSFSSTKEKEKFRLIFVSEEVVTNENKRLFIIKALMSLFPQADKSCTNADRIFFGTNKEVKYGCI